MSAMLIAAANPILHIAQNGDVTITGAGWAVLLGMVWVPLAVIAAFIGLRRIDSLTRARRSS